jgi:hypothetical protein
LNAALSERGLVMGKQVYDATSRYECVTHWLDDLPANGILQWPVMFLYPEHQQSDFIERFTETDTIADHLATMFDPNEQPPYWDAKRQYRPDQLVVFFMTNASDIVAQKAKNYGPQRWTRVPKEYTLLQALQMRDHVIPKFPVFHVFVDKSPFLLEFLTSS